MNNNNNKLLPSFSISVSISMITTFLLILSVSVNAQDETIGPWNISELQEVPNWTTSDIDAKDGVTGILYESLDYLGEKVEVFAYYAAPSGTPPDGGWPAVVFAHGGGGTAFSEVLTYWNGKGYAAISMDLEGRVPSGDSSPNPGPSRVGVWDDYTLPIEEQWYYHAIAQVLKAHTLIASFTEVNADKIGVMGASWGGTITSTVMGVDSRLAWAIPVYGGGYLSESNGHQGDSIRTDAEADFVNTYYDGSAYFDNVTFPTLWLNGLNDFHFDLSVNQKSSQSVQGPIHLLYAEGFAHGNITWRQRDEVYRFANSVVNGGVELAQVGKPYIDSNTGYVTASSDIGIGSAQLFYTTDGDTIDLNDKSWVSTNATISGNTISATIPENSELIFFEITDTEGYVTTSEYLPTSTTDTVDNETSSNGNLALNGSASQSSTNSDSYASKAIDGDTNGVYSEGSVTRTDSDDIPFWQVKLDSEYAIGDINIFGRTDCCLDRLSNFTVIVLDSSGARTFAQTYTSYPDPSITLNLNGALGEIVRVRSNNSLPLSLAEVEVYEYKNLALDGIASQSSTSFNGEASRAIDGNTDGAYSGDSVTHTSTSSDDIPYWQVKLDSEYAIGDINIFGRTDDCCLERLSDFTVIVLDSSGARTFTKTYSTYPDPSITLNIDGALGEIVRIRSNNSLPLSLAEVQVYGASAEVSNIQAKEIATVINSNDQLRVYPNPVEDQLTISLDSGKTANYSISDTTGKTILTGYIYEGTADVNVNELWSGLYLIQVSNGIEIFTGKIIKQ